MLTDKEMKDLGLFIELLRNRNEQLIKNLVVPICTGHPVAKDIKAEMEKISVTFQELGNASNEKEMREAVNKAFKRFVPQP